MCNRSHLILPSQPSFFKPADTVLAARLLVLLSLLQCVEQNTRYGLQFGAKSRLQSPPPANPGKFQAARPYAIENQDSMVCLLSRYRWQMSHKSTRRQVPGKPVKQASKAATNNLLPLQHQTAGLLAAKSRFQCLPLFLCSSSQEVQCCQWLLATGPRQSPGGSALQTSRRDGHAHRPRPARCHRA